MESNKYNLPEWFNNLDENTKEALNLWCEATITYYEPDEGDDVIMSDAEFDLLTEELKKNNIIKSWIESVIYRNQKFETKHNTENNYYNEMISLFKIKWGESNRLSELSRFFNLSNKNYNKLIMNGNLFYSMKYDGCSLKIVIKNKDISIITRGGIDVTKSMKTIPDIDKVIKHMQKKYVYSIICGELVINKKIFTEKYSIEAGGNYENPRNFVGGLVKQKEINQSILNDLTFIPCTNGYNPINLFENVWKPLEENTLNNLNSIITEFKNGDILCDGIVLSYNTNKREVKDNYPLNMVAIKFPAPRVKTEVIGFEWTQKKSGKLTPIIKLKPVRLDGSTISYTNGYNIDNLKKKGIGIGSIVEIEKSGDIIPIIVKVIKHSNEIIYPESIPFKLIGKHLIAVDNEESIKFKFIAGLKQLQIQGIGDVLSEQIGKVLNYDIIEVFNKDNKLKLSSVITGSNWIKFSEIYNKNTIYLNELINILQFDNIGPKISIKVAKLLTKIQIDNKNIPSDVINNVCRGEGFKKISESIKRIQSYGVKVLKPIDISDETLTFEMSGNPPKITKSQFVNILKDRFPNSVHISLTKQTKYLFVDNVNNNTSKILKARKYNIKIVSYEDALNGKI